MAYDYFLPFLLNSTLNNPAITRKLTHSSISQTALSNEGTRVEISILQSNVTPEEKKTIAYSLENFSINTQKSMLRVIIYCT